MDIQRDRQPDLERERIDPGLSGQMFETILRSIPGLVAMKDSDLVYQYANPAFCGFLGAESVDIVGKTDYDIFLPEEARQFRDLDTAATDSGESETRDLQATVNGRTRRLRVMDTPVSGDSGGCKGIVVSAIDVTDDIRSTLPLEDIHARAEENEKARLERLQRQQSFVGDVATMRLVAEGDLEAAARMITEGVAHTIEVERVSVWLLNQHRRQLRCVDLFERSKNAHASGTVLDADDYPSYFKAMETSRVIEAHDARTDPRTCEFREGYLDPLGITSILDAAIRVSGRMRGVVCCEHVGEQLTWAPETSMFAGVVADQVSLVLLNRERRRSEEALRESESRLHAIIHSIHAGIVLIDAEDRTVVEVNPAALKLIDARREDVVGSPCSGFICQGGLSHCSVPADDSATTQTECELRTSDNKTVTVLKNIAAMTLNGKRFILESVVDISALKRTERELKHHVEEVAQAKRHLEILVSDTTGREKRMIELKQEINTLLKELGQEPKYAAPQNAKDFLKTDCIV